MCLKNHAVLRHWREFKMPLRRRQQERQKAILVKISKPTTQHVHHAFLYISLPSLHDYDLNCLVSRFIDNVNIRRRISLTLFKLGYLLGGPVINSVFGRRCRKTVPLGREDTRVWYREMMFSQMVSWDFLLARTLARILFVTRLRPPPPLETH